METIDQASQKHLGGVLNFEVRLMYDFQRLRLQSGGRIQKRATEIYQEGPQLERIKDAHKTLHDLELDRLDTVKMILERMAERREGYRPFYGRRPSRMF